MKINVKVNVVESGVSETQLLGENKGKVKE